MRLTALQALRHPWFKITDNIQKGVYRKDDKRWKKASKEVKDLIQKLLVYQPKKRLTALQALKHPWFKITDSNILYDNENTKILNTIFNCPENYNTWYDYLKKYFLGNPLKGNKLSKNQKQQGRIYLI